MPAHAAPGPYRRSCLPPLPGNAFSPPPWLTWQAGPDEAAYTVASTWTETGIGAPRSTHLVRTLGLRVAAAPAQHLRLHLRTLAPARPQPAPTPFEALALRLAGLYAELELAAAPTGELLGLTNQAAIRQTWAALRQELQQAHAAAPSEVVDSLVAGLDRQLAHPAGLGPSLALDYAYAALLGDFYRQPFAPGSRYQQPRGFPHFFDGLTLHFTETLRLDPAAADPAHVVLRLRGELDRAATDLSAIAALIQARLGQPDAPDPARLQATYQATHTLRADTGWPVAVELTVRCNYGTLYGKEYYLAIALQPPSA